MNRQARKKRRKTDQNHVNSGQLSEKDSEYFRHGGKKVGIAEAWVGYRNDAAICQQIKVDTLYDKQKGHERRQIQKMQL